METPVDLSEGGEAYLRAVRGRGVVPDLVYFDPSAPPPDLNSRFERDVAKESESDDGGWNISGGDWIVTLIALALLITTIMIAVKFGGVSAASFAQAPKERNRSGRSGAVELAFDLEAAKADTLEQIATRSDRREALIALSRLALSRAAAANDLRIGRSWTARDALRRLPRAWPHFDAVERIARAAERAHFGGVPVEEDLFQTCLSAARAVVDGPAQEQNA